VVAKWRRREASRRWNWIPHTAAAFVCLNLWFSQAERTILFWGLMWNGKETQNLAGFYLKLLLASENPAPVQAVLMGNSQTRAQIDEELLNPLLGSRLRTFELHYPGSGSYDMFLMQPLVSRLHPQYILCYVTEANFCGGSGSAIVPNFLTWMDLPDLIRRDRHQFISTQQTGYGLLGHTLPVFRLREVLAQRFLGREMSQFKQQRHNLALETSLAERARQAARGYEVSAGSQFQRRAFEDFTVRCQRANQHLIVLCGQMNPLLGDALAPHLREEMLLFLRSLESQHANVTIVENLPRQVAEDYEDLTHVTKPAQERFTRFLAEWLRDFLARDSNRRR